MLCLGLAGLESGSCSWFLETLLLLGLALGLGSCCWVLLSCLVLSCLVLSCLASLFLSCLDLSCLALTCLVLGFLVLGYLVLACFVFCHFFCNYCLVCLREGAFLLGNGPFLVGQM